MSLLVGTSSLPVAALESKWTIENILSPKDIEVEFDNPVLMHVDSAAADRQLGEMDLNGGALGDAIHQFDTSLGTLKRYLKPDDERVQSARLALAEAQLRGKNVGSCLNNLRAVLNQKLVSDRKRETKIRKGLSKSELQEKGVESEVQFEQRYQRLTKLIQDDPAAAAVYRAQLLFWDNRLLDALRLTRIGFALKKRDVTASDTGPSGTAGGDQSVQAPVSEVADEDEPTIDTVTRNTRAEALFLQSMIYFAQGKRDQLADARKRLLDLQTGQEKSKVWDARSKMIDGLLSNLDGRYAEAIELFTTAATVSRKSEDRFDTLLFRTYHGNTLLQTGDAPAAYSMLNGVFETSRRLVDGREKGLLYQRMAKLCLDEMYECLLVRMSYEGDEKQGERPFKEDYDKLVEALYHVGYQHKTTGRQERAQRMFWCSIDICEKKLPANKSRLGYTLYDLAESYFWDETYDSAIALFRRCADVRKSIDPESNDYIMTLNTLARVYLASGDSKEAIVCMQSALLRYLHREELQGARIARIVSSIKNAKGEAPNMVSSGDRYLEKISAMPLSEQLNVVAESRKRSDPDKRSQIDDLWQVLADTYSRDKSYDEAAEVSRELLKLRKDSKTASASEMLGSLWQLAYICGVSNRLPDADKYYTEMIDKHRDTNSRHLAHWHYARGVVVDSLGKSREASKDFKIAVSEYKKQVKALDKIENQERVQQLNWMIDDLELELKAKSRCPAKNPDYVHGYEMCHWGSDRFPLKVYIDDSEQRGFGPKLYKYMKKSVDEWAETPGMEGRFVFVDDREKADIYFERVSNYDLIPYGSGGGASASFVRRGNRSTKEIDRVHLRLYCKEHDLDKLSNHAIEQLYTLALHEFGHGLGLGHSPSGLDVMYWKSAMNRLSSRDRSTLRKIYGCKVESLTN